MLSTKQLEYLAACSHRWNFKIGATGSGKSWLDYAVVIPKRLLALRGEGAAVLLGHTQGTLSRNILDPMREIWGEGLVGTISSDNTARLFGRKVYILGADKRNQVARIQGMTIEYAYGDEVTTWNEDLFQMLKTRLRCAHSHFDGTANPADPHHWLKKFIDSGADIFCQTSTIDDNPTLDPAFVAQLKQELAGTVYYARFILGQWCAAEGIIYRMFADSQATGDGRFLWPRDKPLPAGTRVQIGVDFGGNGSKHAFVATGLLPDAAGVVALCSDRVDPKGTDTAFLAGKFLDFVRQVFAGWGEIHAVYCDSAEQVLKNSLRSALLGSRFSWLAGRVGNSRKIPINDRIRLTCILMGRAAEPLPAAETGEAERGQRSGFLQGRGDARSKNQQAQPGGGRFWVMPGAASLAEALSTALWSGTTPGQDQRLDDGTTDIDSLDAFEYTIERERNRLLNL